MNTPNRARVGWWAFVLALAATALYLAYSFVGILVLGVFGYYATRPICNRLSEHIGSDRQAASLTVLIVLLPLTLLVIYVGVGLLTEIGQVIAGTDASALTTRIAGLDSVPLEQRQKLISFVSDPFSAGSDLQGFIKSGVLTGLIALRLFFETMILVSLSITLSYTLLARDEAIYDGLVTMFGGTDSTAYAYGLAVDKDLESVFFGNFLFVLIMAVIASVTYAVTNAVAPKELHIPMVIALGFLTGVTSIIPLVVGKLVYLPVVALLAFQAVQAGGEHLPFVGGVLLVYFFVLDLLPQTVVQPMVSGRKFDMMILLFGYILGPILFGWYGFFLLPIVFILIFEAVRIVLPELVRGKPLTDAPVLGKDAGVDPRERRDDATTDSESHPTTDGESHPTADSERHSTRDSESHPTTDNTPSDRSS